MTPTGTGVGERHGMDATGQHRPQGSGGHRPAQQRSRCLDAAEIDERLEEEVARCMRHGTPLCCLMVRLADLAAIEDAHGAELAQRALLHACDALLGQARRFDRIGCLLESELLMLLPGADATAGEAVARRGLARLHAIKIEAGGRREPLSVAVSIAAWQPTWSAQRLIEEVRAAAGVVPSANGGPETD